jgi:hypothetical protein
MAEFCEVKESMDTQQAIEKKDSYLRMMEAVPTQVYLGAALGSIVLSALTRLAGKKDAAVFFGQWPPTFILFALVHKLLQPSSEQGFDEARQATDEASRMVGAR